MISSILPPKKWKTLTLPNFCDSCFFINSVDHWISNYCACSWWPTTLIVSIINIVIYNFVMCIIDLFISFVSVILFVCFNNSIFLWRRYTRIVLKILFVFLFPDSFQLLLMFLFKVFITLASESLDMRLNTRICSSWDTLLFSSLWESFLMKFFTISFFVSISISRKWISFSRFAIILLSTSVWCSS